MKAAAVVIGALIGVVLLLVFATGVLDKRARPTQLCDNSLCITAPAGWHGETYYGGTSSQLVLRPFSRRSEGEGSPPTPPGKVQIAIFNYWRYRFGWPRRDVLSIGRGDLKRTHDRVSRSSVYRKAYFRGHSIEVLVYFGDSDPSSDEIERVNRILSTIRRASPPKPTQ